MSFPAHKFIWRQSQAPEAGIAVENEPFGAGLLDGLVLAEQSFSAGDSLSKLLLPLVSGDQFREILNVLKANDINPNMFWKNDSIGIQDGVLLGKNKGVEFTIPLISTTEALAAVVEAELGEVAQAAETTGARALAMNEIMDLSGDVALPTGVTETSLLGSLYPEDTMETLGHLDNLLNDRRAEVAEIAAKHGVDLSLVMGVAVEESKGDPDAVSPVGAQGVMMLMPDTATELGVEDPFDFAQNVDGGAQYLSQLLQEYDGNRELALAAYNYGLGNVNRLIGEHGASDYGTLEPHLPAETRAYVPRVLAYAEDSNDWFPVIAVASEYQLGW